MAEFPPEPGMPPEPDWPAVGPPTGASTKVEASPDPDGVPASGVPPFPPGLALRELPLQPSIAIVRTAPTKKVVQAEQAVTEFKAIEFGMAVVPFAS